MCGIIGYVGYRRCQDILFDGLKRLEYRGYDSAGLAWREDGRIRVRARGGQPRLARVRIGGTRPRRTPRCDRDGDSNAGARADRRDRTHALGHARRRHRVSNAHPHEDASGRVRIVLNGIIENYLELRERLEADMIQCSSETDAEVVAQLIALYYDGDLADAVRRSLDDLSGHYAFVAMCDEEPDTLVGVRRECPLVVGIGDGEQFIASSISAFLAHTRAGAWSCTTARSSCCARTR